MALWRKWRKLCATYANVPSGTNIENIEKTSIYGTFGTEMPHGTLAQVAQTSYMKGEFLCLLFIIMSINIQKRTAKLGIKDIYFIIREDIRKLKKQQGINLLA